MGHVIAVANMKGGVGKTATVLMLSHALAANANGSRILIIDTDAQASVSFCTAGDALHAELIRSGKTTDAFLEDYWRSGRNPHLADYVRPAVGRVMHNNRALDISLIAASPGLRAIERGLIHALTRPAPNTGYQHSMEQIEAEICRIIAPQLAELRRQFDFILVDCAPGISLMTEAAIRIADLVIVPTIPDYLSVLGLNAFTHSVWANLVDTRAHSRQPHVLITRFRMNVNAHLSTVAALIGLAQQPHPGFRLFSVKIREAAAVPVAIENAATGYPLFQNLWGGALVSDLQTLVNEVRSALA
jgi:cellulose biosynthesis protein BcsQ